MRLLGLRISALLLRCNPLQTDKRPITYTYVHIVRSMRALIYWILRMGWPSLRNRCVKRVKSIKTFSRKNLEKFTDAEINKQFVFLCYCTFCVITAVDDYLYRPLKCEIAYCPQFRGQNGQQPLQSTTTSLQYSNS
ncbi:hypothetical protein PUN28_003978 [Cardiocondyla obscurior]|uniref:Secreted protein n=1 Tax=Cardiocondyla obscurior TaxID=286306 RepID=A0AAW2GPA5_9HYME